MVHINKEIAKRGQYCRNIVETNWLHTNQHFSQVENNDIIIS
jgi:hypothetical protein